MASLENAIRMSVRLSNNNKNEEYFVVLDDDYEYRVCRESELLTYFIGILPKGTAYNGNYNENNK